MAQQTDATLAAWIGAARTLAPETYAAVAADVARASRGNAEDEADALPRALVAVAAGQNTRAAVVMAVTSARRNRLRAERAREAAADYYGRTVADVAPDAPRPALADALPTLPPADAAILRGVAADALTRKGAALAPDAPRPLRVSVVAAALGAPAPRKAAESLALRAAASLAWARVSVVVAPGRTVRYVGPVTRDGRAPYGPELALADRAARTLAYVLRSKRPDATRGAIRATSGRPSVNVWVGGMSREWVAPQDGTVTRSLGYRPVLPVQWARTPSPTLRNVGEGVRSGASAYGLGERETPAALRARREAAEDTRQAEGRAATVHAAERASANGPRPEGAAPGAPGAWAGGVWVTGEDGAPVRRPFSGGGWVVPTLAERMAPRADVPTPDPVREAAADALRPCARPVPATDATGAPADGPGCGCGARRKGAPLADGGAHALVPCEAPTADGRCGCGRKAGALVRQGDTLAHAPRARRR